MAGSYAGAGYLITTIDSGTMDINGTVSDYARWLDLDEGVARTAWTQDSFEFFRSATFAQTCFFMLILC